MSAPLWDAGACCPYFQTGACAHTEAPDGAWGGSDFDYVDAATARAVADDEARHRQMLAEAAAWDEMAAERDRDLFEDTMATLDPRWPCSRCGAASHTVESCASDPPGSDEPF